MGLISAVWRGSLVSLSMRCVLADIPARARICEVVEKKRRLRPELDAIKQWLRQGFPTTVSGTLLAGTAIKRAAAGSYALRSGKAEEPRLRIPVVRDGCADQAFEGELDRLTTIKDRGLDGGGEERQGAPGAQEHLRALLPIGEVR